MAGALALTTAGTLVAMQSSADAAPQAAAHGAARHVAYLGHTFTVPAGWSVVDLARSPSTCVSFDLHAIYLGTPSSSEKCPASGESAVTGAILVEPSGTASGTPSAQDDAIGQRITATLGNARITASYGTDRSVVLRILASAGVPTPSVESMATAPRLLSSATGSAPALNGVVLTYIVSGLGFDACTAPSTAQMTAWGSSPYKTIGVYFGGADRTCAQPELSASWVSTEAAAGWKLLPLYAGPEVDTIPSQLTSPASQGTAAANDAVTQAKAIGLGTGSLLYYDMEGGNYTAAASSAVETFLNAWTAQVHALGYHSAVYGQENGALAVLNADWGKMAEPDVIDVDNPNGLQNDDPGADPANHWAIHRVHQFVANVTQTYGGVAINIDEDFFDVSGYCHPLPTSGGGVMHPNYVWNCIEPPFTSLAH